MSVRLYRLHYEILQFYQFMIPTEEEHAVRQQVINRITNVINQYLPTASVRRSTHTVTLLLAHSAHLFPIGGCLRKL
jgi:DNA polymerase sigma